MTAENLPVPQENELYARIAAMVPDADAEQVRAVLTKHDVRLTSPLPARRELRVRRLYCEGTKEGTEGSDGPFAIDIPLGPGPWVIASRINSAGKSSLLWALSFALRGEGLKDFRRAETEGWFSYVRADIEVAGVAASIRLTFDKPARPRADLLTADSIDQLLALEGREEGGVGVRKAASAGPDGVGELIDRFMLDRLGLRPVSVWKAKAGAPKDADGNRDSAEQVHRWSSFSYAITLNSGHDTNLLGPTHWGQLPARLLQIFLDVPYASELTRLTAEEKKEGQDGRHVQRRAREDALARRAQTEPLREALSQARERLTALEAGQPNLTGLLADVDAAAQLVARDQANHRHVQEQFVIAHKARLKDARNSRRSRQSQAARLLLGALDPEACPRCDREIDEKRRAQEDSEHRCAVCAHRLPDIEDDRDAQAAALQRLADREEASRTAEEQAQTAVQAAVSALESSRASHDQAEHRLAAARSGDWYAKLEAARREVYQIEGALAVATGTHAELPDAVGDFVSAENAATIGQVEDSDTLVLAAATKVLKQVVAEHSRALFKELNEEIVRIARKLGVTNLTSVNLDLSGRVNAKKSGAPRKFEDFSPTERLRMRIATVVGMITIGRKHGIMSHPGLLLIDAPTAEELVPGDARLVLETLYETATSIPGMQIVITSIEEALWEIFPNDRIVTGSEDRQLF
ncbi:hypothetical protein ABZ957_09875 [Streptomyces sp. NPDC046316]|uniref:hypothetical protein n=1 Tax=Streptomyces sp. NPDC046316 TaxID=3154494 RepID=UPI0033D6DCB7